MYDSVKLEMLTKNLSSFLPPLFVMLSGNPVFATSMLIGAVIQRSCLYKKADPLRLDSSGKMATFSQSHRTQVRKSSDLENGLLLTGFIVLGAAISTGIFSTAFVTPVIGLLAGELASRIGEEISSFIPQKRYEH